MMNAFVYLLEVNLYLLVFYLLYIVLLRNETFFRANRYYLVGSSILSLLLPFFKAQWVRDLFVTEKVQILTQKLADNVVIPNVQIAGFTDTGSAGTVVSAAPYIWEEPRLTSWEWLWFIYLIIVSLLLIKFFLRLYMVRETLAKGSQGTAFSFFNRISVDDTLPEKDVIITHEMAHARQWHSADVIFFELLAVINWFNPVAYWYKHSIRSIHEFIADETAASAFQDKSRYAVLLVSNAFNTQPNQLTNNFFNQSLLKRRLVMLNKHKSRKVAILKYGLSAPLFTVMIIFSSASVGKTQIVKQMKVDITQNLSRVILVSPKPEKNPDQKKPADKKPGTRTATDKIYTYKMVDTMAEYPGGLQSLYEYFTEKFKYSSVAKEKGMKGQLVARFIVEKDGSLSNIDIVRDPGFETSAEAIRLLQNSPKWKPAYLNKHTIRSWVDFPVNLFSAEFLMPEKDEAEKMKMSLKDTIAAFDQYDMLKENIYKPLASRARFPGGVTAFNKYVSENMKYPEEARKNNISGIVNITFAVNKDGSIDNISVPEGIGHGCDEEAIRLIENSPKWIPGHYPDGSPERMAYSLYIIFQAGKNTF